jgi:hypothetical protein
MQNQREADVMEKTQNELENAEQERAYAAQKRVLEVFQRMTTVEVMQWFGRHGGKKKNLLAKIIRLFTECKFNERTVFEMYVDMDYLIECAFVDAAKRELQERKKQ